MPTALIRTPPASFHRALVREGRPRLDVELARAQHAEYRRRLEAGGYQVEELPPDDAYPDSVFIEDTAVVLGGVAVITRPGAPSRRGETGPVAAALGRWFPTRFIEPPGVLDGGDVIVLGDTVYVGLSERTNRAGMEQLSTVAWEQGLAVVPVDVHGALHLKSAVLPVGAETVVVTPGAVEEERLAGLDILYEDSEERLRFSALPLPDGSMLVTASAPRTTHMLFEHGLAPTPIDISQFQAADGGLTCMSLVF